MFKRFLTTSNRSKISLKNSDISAKNIFLISHTGNDLGLKNLNSSIKSLKEGFELIQVSSSSPLGKEIPTVKEFPIVSPKKPKKVQTVSQLRIKRMGISANIDNHDKAIKINKIHGFLEKGHQVRLDLVKKKGPIKNPPIPSLSELSKNILQDLNGYKHTVDQESLGKIELIIFPKKS